jgi:hypothetical protein
MSKIQVSLKYDKNRVLYMKNNVHFSNYISSFLVKIRNVSVISCRENQITFCAQ